MDSEFEPIFAELDRRGPVVYLHPAGNSGCSPLVRDFDLTWMVGAPIEDTSSTMQLITRGIPSRYPDIKIINSYLAGAPPMLLQRADDQYVVGVPANPRAAERCGANVVRHRRPRPHPGASMRYRIIRR